MFNALSCTTYDRVAGEEVEVRMKVCISGALSCPFMAVTGANLFRRGEGDMLRKRYTNWRGPAILPDVCATPNQPIGKREGLLLLSQDRAVTPRSVW